MGIAGVWNCFIEKMWNNCSHNLENPYKANMAVEMWTIEPMQMRYQSTIGNWSEGHYYIIRNCLAIFCSHLKNLSGTSNIKH